MSEAAAAAQTAYSLFAGSAYDPTAAGGLLAWQRPTGVALIRRGDATRPLPGSHPALASGALAWIDGDATVIADPATLAPRARHATPGAGVIALSPAVLAWRTRDAAGTDRLWARVLATPEPPRLLLESPSPTEIGRPALLGGIVLCHLAGPRGSRLLAVDAASGAQTVLRAEADAQLSNPSTDGTRMLYVRATGVRQELRIGLPRPAASEDDRLALIHASPGRRDREHEPGRRRHRQGYHGKRPPLPPRSPAGVVATLWSTALTGEAAYVTRLRAVTGASPTADILRVPAPE
jgi:hypothetical protein